MKDVVTAVAVTYNRKHLLLECLGALRSQIHRPDRIVILDNACTDGTSELLAARGILDEPDIGYTRLQVNDGAAGGFYWGIRYAYDQGADWIWVMERGAGRGIAGHLHLDPDQPCGRHPLRLSGSALPHMGG